MIKRLFAGVAAAALLSFGAAGAAFAQETTLPHTGQGTNDDGTCAGFEDDDRVDPAEGRQAWHFVLTGQGEPGDATMAAEFDDGTAVSGLGPLVTAGQTAHFYVETAEGAALLSASATFDQGQAGANPQFTVSHCVEGANGENGNGEEENGNGEEENGNGEEEDAAPTPEPIPTDMPAGIDNSGGGFGGTGAILAGMSALALAAWAVGRRFVKAA